MLAKHFTSFSFTGITGPRLRDNVQRIQTVFVSEISRRFVIKGRGKKQNESNLQERGFIIITKLLMMAHQKVRSGWFAWRHVKFRVAIENYGGN